MVIEGEIKPGDDVEFHNDEDHRAHDFHDHPPDVDCYNEKEFYRYWKVQEKNLVKSDVGIGVGIGIGIGVM